MVEKGLDSENLLKQAEPTGFVEVMFAKSSAEADLCCDYLGQRDIPARLESSGASARNCGIAILVPSDRFIEASELLAARLQGDPEDEVDDDGGDYSDDDADDDDDEFDDDDDDLDDDDDDFEEDEEEAEKDDDF